MPPVLALPILTKDAHEFSWKEYFKRCWAAAHPQNILRLSPSLLFALIRLWTTYKTRFIRLFERLMFPNRKRKALLIGIRKGEGEDTLSRPHDDVRAMRELLINIYGYKDEDIVIMLDDGASKGPGMSPTHHNILRAIDELVKDARSGDRFVFHFSGHSTQVPNRTGTEDDGMDEAIIPSDDQEIIDNILRERLVEPLPVGSNLVAIFDTCHSASLLDLTHHRCNRLPAREGISGKVHVPWTPVQARMSIYQHQVPAGPYKPRRRNATTATCVESPTSPTAPPRKKTSRKTTLEIRAPTSEQPTRITLKTGSSSPGASPQMERWRTFGSPISKGTGRGMEAILEGNQLTEEPRESRWLREPDAMRYGSPENTGPYLVCDGGRLCEEARAEADARFANVIALGACKDAQTTWEDQDAGKTMTMVLVEHLSNDPSMPLEDLMRKISDATYRNVEQMHRDWEAYKKQAGDDPDLTGGPDFSKEWQDPQLASHWKLDMKLPFLM